MVEIAPAERRAHCTVQRAGERDDERDAEERSKQSKRSRSAATRELSELVCAAGERGRSARTTLWRVRVNQALNGWAPFGRPRCIGYGKAPLVAALALCVRAGTRAERPRQEAAAA